MAKTAKTTTKNESIRKKLQGIVVSDKMDKTIVVRVESKYAHPLYGKIVKVHKKYKVHCEDDTVTVGDDVIIEEGAPVSKRKTFTFIRKLEK